MIFGRFCRWLRAAISGTTPPKGLCSSNWVKTTLERIARSSETTAAAVSSHDVSIPRNNIIPYFVGG